MKIKAYCKICGQPYMKMNGKSLFCSDECKKQATKIRQAKWREEHPGYHQQYHAAHPEAVERFKEKHPNYNRDRWRKIRNTEEHQKVCVICGKPFVTMRPQKETCSNECARALKAMGRRARESRNPRRIPKMQRIDKDITLRALYKRDSGVCYLCGGKCDWKDRDGLVTGHLYPSIDHVIPISRGGLHSWDNVRLAHFSCNARKSDRVMC